MNYLIIFFDSLVNDFFGIIIIDYFNFIRFNFILEVLVLVGISVYFFKFSNHKVVVREGR